MRKAQVLIPIVAILAIMLILFSLSLREIGVDYIIQGSEPTSKYIQLFYFIEESLANGTQTGFKYINMNYNKSDFNPKTNILAIYLTKIFALHYYNYTLNKASAIIGQTDMKFYINSTSNPYLLYLNGSLNKGKGSYFNLTFFKNGIFRLNFYMIVSEAKIVISNSSIYNYYLVILNYKYEVYFGNERINITNQFETLVNGSENGNFAYLRGQTYLEFILPANCIGKTIIGLKDSYGIIGWVLV
jgi:hypothetical protein